MSADIDDLIGPPAPGEAVPKGPPIVITTRRGDMSNEKAGISLELSDVHAGVSVTWLASVWGMGTESIKRKLADCPPMKREKNAKIYNLRQAAGYLSEPKVNIDEYIKRLRPGDLPPALSKDYWDAKLKRQKWELEAGDLWRTVDVLDVFGETFKHIRTTTQLWLDTVERTEVLSAAQRETLQRLADGLLEDIHRKLVQMPAERKTESLLGLEGEDE